MSALLFPGQGSQIVGMGSEFYNNFDIVKKIFKDADDKLNQQLHLRLNFYHYLCKPL